MTVFILLFHAVASELMNDGHLIYWSPLCMSHNIDRRVRNIFFGYTRNKSAITEVCQIRATNQWEYIDSKRSVLTGHGWYAGHFLEGHGTSHRPETVCES